MWTIIKIDKKKVNSLKEDFRKKLGEEVSLYCPRFLINQPNNNKNKIKELPLMGDYLFCFNEKFSDPQIINSLKYSRGLKYFLEGFIQSQSEIQSFISRCKDSEDKKGYLTHSFFKLYCNSSYKFSSGPFVNNIFKIINLQKNKIKILIGDLTTTLTKNKFSFTPI